jgi:hypothetical protein
MSNFKGKSLPEDKVNPMLLILKILKTLKPMSLGITLLK